MGKLAQKLGVGVKGDISVVHEKEVYMTGETVIGVVKVHITQPVECGALVLTVRGCETIGWYETTADSRFLRTNEFLLDQLVLNAQVGLYETGDYEFPFAYRLRDDLPGSFEMKNRSANNICDVDDKLAYTLSVQLPVTTRMAADLSASESITVVSTPNSIESKPVSETASKHIFSLGCIPKGDSCATLSMDRDVFIAGETIEVQVTIENLTSKKVASAKVLVYEDIEINVPDRGAEFGSRVVCEKKLASATGSSSQLIDERVSLPLTYKANGLPFVPTTSASFIRWRYRVAVQCKYRLAGRFDADAVIYILRYDPVPAIGYNLSALTERSDAAPWAISAISRDASAGKPAEENIRTK